MYALYTLQLQLKSYGTLLFFLISGLTPTLNEKVKFETPILLQLCKDHNE